MTASSSWLTPRGGKVLVPAKKIAYVEFGANEPRRVGFSNL